MKNLHGIDIASVLVRLAGLSILASDVTFQQAIGTLFNGNGQKIVAAIGLIAVISADILRVIGNPSPPVGTVSVVAPTPTPGTIAMAAPGTTTEVEVSK